MTRSRRTASVLLAAVLGCAGCGVGPSDRTLTVRAAHFPNLTHAQALVGCANGAFERALGPDVRLEWKVFNAGPSVIEAIFAGQLDVAYVGPSPAVNGYVRSDGRALRVVAGAASGGAALVVRPEAGIRTPADLHGKRVATPQLGNTQDVALRAWMAGQGLESTETGGDVKVTPIANADQLSLFLKGELDAAWSVEPWVSVFERQAGVRVWIEESSLWPGGRYATTLVVVRKEFADRHPEIVRRFVTAHVEITDWIRLHPAEAKRLINQELERLTRKPIPAGVMDAAFARLEYTVDPLKESVLRRAADARKAGYLRRDPDLSQLYDESFLVEARRSARSTSPARAS